MVYLETDRLILRNYQLKDINDFYELMSQEFVARHQGFAPLSLESCEKSVTKMLDNDSYLACELKENGKVIGTLEQRKDDDGSGNYTIGYEFSEKYGKKGYATESTRALIAHLFLALDARRICANMSEVNVDSWRLVERLGFRREAHFIECEPSFNQKDEHGNPILDDCFVYALLKKEWQHTV
ncbi:MAG: GNAT family N-acetyltransferase [Defluviitaleaceae bacterium]|nr:GNAT family N-acetyltransferase [Defluviitaleaceae bacterium]